MTAALAILPVASRSTPTMSAGRKPASVVSLDAARQRRLIAQHADLVDRQVRRAMAKVGFCCEADELRSAAYIGLIEAAQRYDGARGIPFEAFASHRIHGAILDELRSRDQLRRLSRRRAREVQQAREKLVRKLQREPTEQELARASGESLETFRARAARERSQTTVSLEDVGTIGWEEAIAAPEDDALDALCEAELKRELTVAVSELPERLQVILKSYYEGELSYREIGKTLGVTESRVCQLVKGVQQTLRQRLCAYAA